MSFAAPLILLGLVALPALAAWYVSEQRRRAAATAAFVSAPLVASVAPRRAGVRRHVSALIIGLALAALIVAAARPRYDVTVPVKGATVMLVNDISSSMTATDVSPTRLAAAQKAAIAFTRQVPDSIAVGSVEFAGRPTLLQSPSRDHALAADAIRGLATRPGGTAIGAGIETALSAIKTAPKVDNKRPPGTIVLLSDGASNAGISPITAAAAAKHQTVKIDTVAIGTAHGTITETAADGAKRTVPVPVNPGELEAIARDSDGSFEAALNQASAKAIYSHLATTLGHMKAKRGLTSEVAGLGLVLLLLGAGLSLRWFGELT